MSQALMTVVAFVGLIAMLPMGVKWLAQRRAGAGTPAELLNSKLISVLAVGQQQRVITVEVGPAHARTWLVLGVTAQSITPLHTLTPEGVAARAPQATVPAAREVLHAAA